MKKNPYENIRVQKPVEEVPFHSKLRQKAANMFRMPEWYHNMSARGKMWMFGGAAVIGIGAGPPCVDVMRFGHVREETWTKSAYYAGIILQALAEADAQMPDDDYGNHLGPRNLERLSGPQGAWERAGKTRTATAAPAPSAKPARVPAPVPR